MAKIVIKLMLRYRKVLLSFSIKLYQQNSGEKKIFGKNRLLNIFHAKKRYFMGILFMEMMVIKVTLRYMKVLLSFSNKALASKESRIKKYLVKNKLGFIH